MQNLNEPHIINQGDLENIAKGDQEEERDITTEYIEEAEIMRAIKNTKNGKAVGRDDIPNEFLKNSSDMMIKSLNQFLTMF